MAQLTSLLPLPRHSQIRRGSAPPPPSTLSEIPLFEPPPYGKRQGFTPRTVEDFGDGGAFPEIHVLQYPLNMGREDNTSIGTIVPLKVDAEGNVKFDAIARQGHKKDRQVFANPKDAMGMEESGEMDDDPDAITRRPDDDEARKIAEETRSALALIVDQKVAAAQPTHIAKQNLNDPVFIRYTPNQQGEAFNSGARQRIIRLQEMPVDPLDPPKFQHKKLPQAPPSPPAPVMHSPPRKITVQDQQNWKIPPCISNWKNIKGYTMALDKRLAADGRTLQEVQINDKFAKLSEALFIAERTARKEIDHRAKMMQMLQKKKKEATEEQLRKLASEARKAGAKTTVRETEGYDEVSREDESKKAGEDKDEEAAAETEDAVDDRGAREDLRRERKREMKRDLRMEQKKVEKAGKKRGAKGAARERDVSEKIALGQQVARSADSAFDQRLFNQTEGMDSGFGDDDSYSGVYSKPLFDRGVAGVYRPKPVEADSISETGLKDLLEKSTSRFKPDRGFEGAEEGTRTAPRDKPVAFEKEAEADPFGIGQMLSAVKKGRGTLDKIGTQGHMSASAGSASGTTRESYREGGSRRRERIGFEESSSKSDSSNKKRRH
jgi:SNW domain-containing protein 1